MPFYKENEGIFSPHMDVKQFYLWAGFELLLFCQTHLPLIQTISLKANTKKKGFSTHFNRTGFFLLTKGEIEHIYST